MSGDSLREAKSEAAYLHLPRRLKSVQSAWQNGAHRLFGGETVNTIKFIHGILKSDLPYNDKLRFMAIAAFINGRTGRIHTRQSVMAKKLGCSRKALNEIISKMQEKGYMKVQRMRRTAVSVPFLPLQSAHAEIHLDTEEGCNPGVTSRCNPDVTILQ